MVKVLRAAEAPVVPWRNGGGITREYLKVGGDDFSWRLSMAEISEAGPFSAFPGVDRILVFLSGGGVSLSIDRGQSVRLERPLEWLRFAGEVSVDAVPLDGPSTDLNLMWRRDLWSASCSIRRIDGPQTFAAVGTVVVFIVDGELMLDDCDLAEADALVFDDDVKVLGGAATVLWFDLTPTQGSTTT